MNASRTIAPGLTGNELAEDDRIERAVRGELPELLLRNSESPGHATREDLEEAKQLAAFLRAERERQNVPLATIAKEIRYPLELLTAVDEGREPNPPLALLTRYARALGKRMLLVLRQGETSATSRVSNQAKPLDGSSPGA